MKIINTPRTTPRIRGSALIYVTAVLGLLTLMGAAYLQQARLDRVATEARTRSNIDTVVSATVGYIQQTLRRDLLDKDGRFFNPDDDGDGTGTGFAEPYDYPWTNDASDFEVILDDGSTDTAKGGEFDDTWLAASEPDSSGGVWPHLSNLNGIYLRLPKTGDAPQEYVIDPTAANANSDTDVDRTWMANEDLDWESWGADASGNGILDSRWTWAPIKRLGSTKYVMAVRIIDNSAMVNADVALSQVDTSGAYDTQADAATGTNQAPRWWYPSELDLGMFVFDVSGGTGGNGPDHMEFALDPLLAFRLDGPPATIAAPDWFLSDTDALTRYFHWHKGPRLYGNYNDNSVFPGLSTTYKQLGVQDELALRFREGLKNENTTSTIESRMRDDANSVDFLRDAATGETTYQDVTLPDDGANPASVEEFYEEEPRHQMTTRSGAAIHAPRLTSETVDAPIVKRDVNQLLNLPPLRDIANPDTSGNDVEPTRLGTLAGLIQNFGEPAPGFAGTPAEFADQLAANLRDYADTDNVITEYNGRFGFEALPVITEVYVQRFYELDGNSPYDTGTDGNGNGHNDFRMRWEADNQAGYAIEIRNPFNRTIPLTGIELVLAPNGGTEVVLGDLETLSGSTTLGPDEFIVFYRESNASTPDPLFNEIGSGFEPNGLVYDNSGNGFTYQRIALTEDWPDDETATNPTDPTSDPSDAPYTAGFDAVPVNVELRAESTDGSTTSTVTYCRALSQSAPDVWGSFNDTTDTPLTGSTNDYYQYLEIGNGNGLNMMATDFSQYEPIQNLPEARTGSGSISRDITADALGLADKRAPLGEFDASPAGPADTISNLDEQQWLMSDQGAIHHVGELAHVVALGPEPNASPPQTIREVWGNTADIRDFMLPFEDSDGATLADIGADHLAIPWNSLLLSRLTTLSPAEDGVDNDGDGTTDETDEMLVPGTINLNTAPEHLLERILPFPDGTTRENMAADLAAYRAGTRPTGFGGGYRVNPGFASIGELMHVLGLDAPGFDSPPNNDNRELAGTVIDFLPAEGTDPDGITDDREERYLWARQLMQVASVRSDIFTAYVVIRGYPAQDFSKGVVESARFFAVFDRSSVVNQDSPVKVLAMFRFP